MRIRPQGFTLIELLVVVTIIVVLLALIAPALDSAIYQAELTVCAAQCDGVGSGATSYAMDSRRFYPHREPIWDPGYSGGYQPRELTAPFNAQTQANNLAGYDLRPRLDTFISLKQLQCPPAGKVDLATPPASGYVLGSYMLYFGYKYQTANFGGSGMVKIGDRLTYDVAENASDPLFARFNVLAIDTLADIGWVATFYASHPDSEGVLAQKSAQQGDTDAASQASGANPDNSSTYSDWRAGLVGPGRFDLNAGFDDGSVTRYSRVHHEVRVTVGKQSKDDRFYAVPAQFKGSSDVFWQPLPK